MSHGAKRTDDDDDGGGSDDDDDYAENLNMVNFIEKVALHKKKMKMSQSHLMESLDIKTVIKFSVTQS